MVNLNYVLRFDPTPEQSIQLNLEPGMPVPAVGDEVFIPTTDNLVVITKRKFQYVDNTLIIFYSFNEVGTPEPSK